MDTTSFLATTIQRIARKKLTSTLLWMGALCILFLCFLSLLWLMKFLILVYPFVMLAGLIVGGLILRSALLLSRAIRNPIESFFVNDLKRYGPLQQTIEQIDREASLYMGTIGSFVTQHWIVSALSGSLSFMRLEDTVWIYKRQAESRVTFDFAITISSGKSYTAQIWDRYGYPMSIPSTERGVDSLLGQIAKAAPWVTLGYLDLLNEAWNRRRADFIADVDQKHRQTSFVDSGGITQMPLSKPIASLSPASLQPAPLSGFNRAIDQELIEKYVIRQDRKVRMLGCVALLAGFALSSIFIFPMVRAILGNEKGVSISQEGIMLSGAFLAIGSCYTAFGQKGKRALEDFLFKNWWAIILFFIILYLVFGRLLFLVNTT